MEKGKIIFLNGVSSAGKTTLAKTLQLKLSEPFYWISVDTFIMMTPDKFLNKESSRIILNSISAMHHTIKTYSDIGFNAIVDHVFEKSDWVQECVELLHSHPVLFVHVTCSLEELRRREKERGDRNIGQAESQIPMLKNANIKDIYDITVDTFNNSTEECADKIIEMLNEPEKFTAFKILWEQIKNNAEG